MIENIDFSKMGITELLELNAKLQQKKQKVRKELKNKERENELTKQGYNRNGKYQYFTEAQYKKLFTELLTENDLELSYTQEQPVTQTERTFKSGGNGLHTVISLTFILTDCNTGFFEKSHVYGEASDTNDKSLYKAYTGALKYYFANTFLVATDDDPEKESDDSEKEPIENKPKSASSPKFASNSKPASTKQMNWIEHLVKNSDKQTINAIKQKYDLKKLSAKSASEIIELLNNSAKNKKETPKEELVEEELPECLQDDDNNDIIF